MGKILESARRRDEVTALRLWSEEARMAYKQGIEEPARTERVLAEIGGNRILRRVIRPDGFMVLDGKRFYIGSFFAGYCIAIRFLGGSRVALLYRNKRLGFIDLSSGLLEFQRYRIY